MDSAYSQLIANVEEGVPGLMQAIKTGTELLIIIDEAKADDLSLDSLAMIGAVTKLCGIHGVPIIMAGLPQRILRIRRS